MKRLRTAFTNPFAQIGVSATCVTVAEIALKRGATDTATIAPAVAWTGLSGLASGWVWIGMLFMVLSFASWLYVIRLIPLTIAYPLSNVVHISVPLGSWYFLGEGIGLMRWCGIALVLSGLVVIAKPASRLEERL